MSNVPFLLKLKSFRIAIRSQMLNVNLFAETAERLRAAVGVFTLAGESLGVGSCISKLNKKSFKKISNTSCTGLDVSSVGRMSLYRLVLSLVNLRR